MSIDAGFRLSIDAGFKLFIDAESRLSLDAGPRLSIVNTLVPTSTLGPASLDNFDPASITNLDPIPIDYFGLTSIHNLKIPRRRR